MIRRHGAGFRIALMAMDAVLAMAIVSLLIATFPSDVIEVMGRVEAPSLWLTGYAFAWVTLLGTQSLYRPRARWSLRSEAISVTEAVTFLAVGTLVALYVLGLSSVAHVFLLILPIQAIASIVARAALRSALREARRRGRNLRSILIVGTGPSAQTFARRLTERWDLGLRVEGFLGPAVGANLGDGYLGEVNELSRMLHERVIDEVALCLPFATPVEMDALCEICLVEGKTVRIPTEALAHAIKGGHIEDLDGSPVLSLVRGPDKTVALLGKRLMDIVGATVGLIVLSPLFATVAVAILVNDGSPVLFRQRRAGVHGRTFNLVKFRTMTLDADDQRAALRQFNEVSGNASFKMTNDPRVTRMGTVLRRTSIDELPQLWNVLRGEMSLVGPRPHPFDDVSGYDPWHRRRLVMKPGITGLWQIAGRREIDFDRWVQFDLEYIDHWSLWLDLRLLIRTIPAMIRAEGR